MNKLIKTQNSQSNSLVRLISKSVVNFNLIMMSKSKYIVILTGLFFCSVVASGTSHFCSFFFRKYFGKVDF